MEEGQAPAQGVQKKDRTTMEFPAAFLQALHRRVNEDPSLLAYKSPREYIFDLVRRDWEAVGFDPERGFVLPRRTETFKPPLKKKAKKGPDWRNATRPKS